mmetsp:Transcript_3639/g.7767  ORF Transcript_3639/g.7767 Transcript_3639/m.7767 type:complete len:83 (-) Transcript_3639:60-308(-)|eukprot:CAMPEP_0171916918 /NCGR_PEP_ID=MMETSP0993-20121228/15439_1 /TAXON_ID=483369 /ORGANISM="non described non described, Strain CCMP2098" /LENGTH=82 /DNA_ID=CAMNT_0012552553 /DNA_START=668 /DNA_END=916 /DNA_ORIENTATION=+
MASSCTFVVGITILRRIAWPAGEYAGYSASNSPPAAATAATADRTSEQFDGEGALKSAASDAHPLEEEEEGEESVATSAAHF